VETRKPQRLIDWIAFATILVVSITDFALRIRGVISHATFEHVLLVMLLAAVVFGAIVGFVSGWNHAED
jgi:hypothetical protein